MIKKGENGWKERKKNVFVPDTIFVSGQRRLFVLGICQVHLSQQNLFGKE